MAKGSIHNEDKTIINIYVSNVRAPKYMNLTLTELKGETDNSITIVGNFGIPLSLMDKTMREKIINKREGVNNTIYQLVLRHIYRIFHPTFALQCAWSIL